ncbi:MAG TPA: hypothetical protein VLS46_04325, partial [Gaiellaceae bacterium]|nr:hypothetical protein [Gaiellaceae bacterium]
VGVTDNYVAGAGRIVTFTAVEAVEVDGAGGADQIYVLSTGTTFETIITGGSGDDVIHIGGDHPTLVFDPPPFTYTPPAFEVALPPELVFQEVPLDADGFTFTIGLFDFLSRGGGFSHEQIQVAGASVVRDFVLHLQRVLLMFNRFVEVEAPIAANFSARLMFESFFQFIFNPKIEITVGDFQLMYRFGHLEPRSKLIQPPDVTVDPLPFAFKEARSLDASQIQGRVTIRGGDQFETAGDTVVFHNQEGTSNPGRLVKRVTPRMVQAGERLVPGDPGIDDDADGTVDEAGEQKGIPIFEQERDPDTGELVFDTFLSLEGGGLGINDSIGQVSAAGTRYFGIELDGIEHLDLRLADGRAASGDKPFDDGNDSFTIVETSPGTHVTVWAGGGNDTITVNGIGGSATISGGPGNDVITVSTIVDGRDNDGDGTIDEADELNALAGILGRLTIDGDNQLQEQVDRVLGNEQFLQPFLTAPLVIIPIGPEKTTFDGKNKYFSAAFVPILTASTGGGAACLSTNATSAAVPVCARTIVLDERGSIVEKLVQEQGVPKVGKHKTANGLASGAKLYFDAEGNETTDATLTGIPVIVAASSSQGGSILQIYVDEQHNEVFGELGANIVVNGSLDETMASNATAGGWETGNIDGNGGWRST